VETSIKRKLALALAFSNKAHDNKNFEVELDRDRSEEMFTSRFLGELGRDGWELIAFNRIAPRFEAVLKRPMECNDLESPSASS